MKKIITFLIYCSLLIVTYSCGNIEKSIDVEESKNQAKRINETNKTLQQFTKEKINRIEKENVIEFHQKFKSESKESQTLSFPESVNLSKTTGAMLSAYSLDKSEYKVFFKVFEQDTWSQWKELRINTEVKNPNRKVFKAQNLTNNTDSIQFMTNKETDKEIIFRIYQFFND